MDRLIVHCCYHKCMTVFFVRIFRPWCKHFGLKLSLDVLEPDTDVLLDTHSRLDQRALPPFRGTHIVRDPRDLVVSGYFYHLWCKEEWCTRRRRLGLRRSYQSALRRAGKKRGLLLEMEFRQDIRRMAHWNYGNPDFLELRYEQLFGNEEFWVRRAFEHYGCTPEMVDYAVEIARRAAFDANIGSEPHLRKGQPGDWRNHFDEEHRAHFKRLFGHELVALGYEEGFDWRD